MLWRHFGRFGDVLGTILDVLISKVGPNGRTHHLTAGDGCLCKDKPQETKIRAFCRGRKIFLSEGDNLLILFQVRDEPFHLQHFENEYTRFKEESQNKEGEELFFLF